MACEMLRGECEGEGERGCEATQEQSIERKMQIINEVVQLGTDGMLDHNSVL